VHGTEWSGLGVETVVDVQADSGFACGTPPEEGRVCLVLAVRHRTSRARGTSALSARTTTSAGAARVRLGRGLMPARSVD
jgi:hypothetical protein